MEINIPRLSEVLYMTLCHKVGFPTQVTIRRDVADLNEMIDTLYPVKSKNMILTSGSDREGFRIFGSDIDRMMWPTDHKVILDHNQSDYYNSSTTTLIMMECSDTRHGFALLQLLTPTMNKFVKSACTMINDRLYISSSRYREKTLTMGSSKYMKSTIHGPCASGCLVGVLEYDFAHCFSSDFWPSIASSFIERSKRKGWPSSPVLQDIVNNGCHVVAIGRKNSPEEHNEWRISFSVAEQKLVYTMTHCQFLCYGMLKLFLKEVINSNTEEPLLCSYFLKTILFWEIQGQEIHTWTPQNILLCIWQCVKHLIKLVYREECPNFFIATNNMFYGKVVGSARTRLLAQLNELYSNGISCLFHCPSILPVMQILVAYNTLHRININENIWFCTPDCDIQLFKEINIVKSRCRGIDLLMCYNYLLTLQTIRRTPVSVYQSLAIQFCISTALVSTAFHLHNILNGVVCGNRFQYFIDQKVCYMLQLSAKLGTASDILYIAMYHYMRCRYKVALRYIKMAKVSLTQSYLIYLSEVDKMRYTRGEEGMSLSTRIRKVYLTDVIFNWEYLYIHELKLELRVIKKTFLGIVGLYLPPHVMVSFLSVLCYRGSPRKQEKAIHDLKILINDGKYVQYDIKNISWEILGICQEIYGDLYAALMSYEEALKFTEGQLYEIEEATKARIQHVRLAIEALLQ